MIPTEIDYVAPASIGEAVERLQKERGAAVLAGGLSLLTAMKAGRAAPATLVDLRRIAGLSTLAAQPNALRIGATATYDQIAAAPEVKERYAALYEAASKLGDPQVRNRGTIGGGLAYNDPAADLPAVALALEAVARATGPAGERTIAAEQLLVGPFQNSLEPGEVLTAVDFPTPPPRSGSAYEKFRNPASGYAVCGVAVALSLSEQGTVARCRVAITGAGKHSARLRQVEAALEGQAPTAENLAAAAALAARDGLEMVADRVASAEYRAHLATVLTGRALRRAAAAAS